MKHYLTYEELMSLAKEHYSEGGDATFECMDERMFKDYVDMFGGITKKDALRMFRIDKNYEDDLRGCLS